MSETSLFMLGLNKKLVENFPIGLYHIVCKSEIYIFI